MDETDAVVSRVREALIRTALEAYADASMQGLCAEGAWEAAVSAMRRLDLRLAVADLPPTAR